MFSAVFSRLAIRKLFYAMWWLSMGQMVMAEPFEARRIISVDSNATEILQALGVGPQIIAADITSEPLLQGQTIQQLGYHRALSAEAILSLQPDVIVGSDHTGPEATLKAIKRSPIHFIQLHSPENIADLKRNIGLLARQLGRERSGQQLIEDLQKLENALPKHTNRPELKMVFLLDLNDRGLSQAGRDTVGNALISLLNGENISTFNGYQSVSLESILAMDPDVILLGKRSNGKPVTNEFLARYPLLNNTSAGLSNLIISMDAGKLIAGLSITAVEQAADLAKRIYPASE